MNAMLVSVEFAPRGDAGWHSGRLVFGDFLTLVRGPNGSGKTPVMEGISYALGNPASLPAEIRKQCARVTLELRVRGDVYFVSRSTEMSYPVEVAGPHPGGAALLLEDAKQWSEWWLDAFGIPDRTLTDRNQKATLPYVSTVLPFLWVDQDTGWRYSYVPQQNQQFILDQEEELTRLLLGIGAKREYRSRDDYKQAVSAVGALESQVGVRRKMLDDLRRETATLGTLDVLKLEAERDGIAARLRDMQSAADAIHTGSQVFESALEDVRARRTGMSRRIAYRGEQRRQLDQAAAEISAETDLLSQNVVAQQTFRQFCGNPNCQLFAGAEASSYGRRLLYLGDQLKDLRMYVAGLEFEMSEAEAAIASETQREKELLRERDAALKRSGLDNFVTAVGMLSKELAELETRIARIREFLQEQRKFEALLARLEAARIQAAELRPGGTRAATAGVNDARSMYQTFLQEWLRVLNAENLPQSTISDSFKVHFGPDKFTEGSPHSGSTRTRIVLAIHAALLEASLALEGCHPPVLLLDAPRQQELAASDLVAFIEALRALRGRYESKIQLVLAVAELDAHMKAGDVEWAPQFEVGGKRRFLGPAKA